tara:strand:- start:569 stop:757 length:189 start_codon:yes stop_codon:yes gene_type:complete
MNPEDFILKTENDYVQWNIKVDREVDDRWKAFQDEHGKVNKSQLMIWLLEQYMGKHENNINV